MAQGFGSDCNGMSSELNFDSGFRAMSLTKVRKEIDNCNFPDWIHEKNWKVIPRGGLRSPLTMCFEFLCCQLVTEEILYSITAVPDQGS